MEIGREQCIFRKLLNLSQCNCEKSADDFRKGVGNGGHEFVDVSQRGVLYSVHCTPVAEFFFFILCTCS
jgi:hypothetical protein